MGEVVWLVDYENVQSIDQSRIPANARLKVFIGTKQNKLPTELVKLREALKDRFEFVFIDGTESNALDFHIAFYMGQDYARSPGVEFVIVSNDEGFDSLVRHLSKQLNSKCRRNGHAHQGRRPQGKHLDANGEAVRYALSSLEKNKRPRKRATLVNHLVTHFNNRLSVEQISDSVALLISVGQIEETDGKLAYNF